MKPIVVMCLWKRIHNIPKILTCLENQTHKDFDFFIWNNNYEISEQLDIFIAASKITITVHHSIENLYGFARFIGASFYKNSPVIFFDDDQFPHVDFIEYMLQSYSKYGKEYICSWWGRRIKKAVGYWRTKMATPGDVINYAGTGGMVCTNIFYSDIELLLNWPEEYKKACQDIWLSYIFYKKYKLKGMCVEGKIDHVADKFDTFKISGVAKFKEQVFQKLFQKGYYE